MIKNIQYEITETSITDDNDVFVAFKCFVDDVELFNSAIIVAHDASTNDIADQINDRAYNMAMSIIDEIEQTNEHEKEDKEKNDTCKSLKEKINASVGKQVIVNKPKKKVNK